MRFGHWRGVTLAIALTAGLSAASARADWFHTIPREAPAVDYRTGGVMYAPPVPYGHYAKDYLGSVHGAVGLAHGMLNKLCGACMGKGCGLCHGRGKACSTCGDGNGHSHGHGHGMLGHGGGSGCGAAGCNGHHGLFGHGQGQNAVTGHGAIVGQGHGHGQGQGFAEVGPGVMIPSAQQVVPSPQGVLTECGSCLGKGCGRCGGKGLFHHGKGRACGNSGCGWCDGGAGAGAGAGDPCGNCGGRGCGLCGKGGGGHGRGCGLCGGRGCANCLGKLHGLLGGLLHHNSVKYFVGAGGPVPITPGYVPYVVPVRSPRDYFAFPPFTDLAP